MINLQLRLNECVHGVTNISERDSALWIVQTLAIAEHGNAHMMVEIEIRSHIYSHLIMQRMLQCLCCGGHDDK
jgi:hypothetical protein